MVWGGGFLGFGVLGLYNSVSTGLGVALGVCMLLLSCAGGVVAGFSWWVCYLEFRGWGCFVWLVLLGLLFAVVFVLCDLMFVLCDGTCVL